MFYEPSNNDNQQLAVVSEQDNIIGSAAPEKIYYQGLLHRFASIFILDNQSRLLLQKRAFNKNRHAGLFSESVSAQVAFSEKYIDAALRRVNEELGLVLEEHEHDGSSGTRLTQVCKMNIDTKDEDYNYGFTGSIVNNSWRKNAFVTIYECILDHDRIDRLSINPYEISNVYLLSLDKVLEFFNSSPSLFVPGFGFTLKAYLRYYYNER
ncbi:MAG: NUDIX domain-containing protein [Nitrososphaeraceae archaeon]